MILSRIMNQEEIQQAAFDETLVSINDRVLIGSCNMRIDPNKTQRESTYQVVMDTLKLSPCYNSFLVTADVLKIYMQQFWFTITKIKKSSSYQFQLDDQKFQIDVELFQKLLRICLRFPNKEFVKPHPHDSLNPNNLPLFDDDKTNKVVYELHHKAKASPKVEIMDLPE
ncbi:hypothetical protein Tco_1214111 [Tanacetum coccineum]